VKFAGFENEKKEVRPVWILNLVPFLGLGTFYAAGSKILPLMICVWIYEFLIFCTPVGSFGRIESAFQLYCFLSLIGTVVVMAHNHNLEKRMNAARPGNIASLSDSVAATGRLGKPEGDVQALDTFARKVRDAEKRMKTGEFAAPKQELAPEASEAVSLPSRQEPVPLRDEPISVPRHRPDLYYQFAPENVEPARSEETFCAPVEDEVQLEQPTVSSFQEYETLGAAEAIVEPLPAAVTPDVMPVEPEPVPSTTAAHSEQQVQGFIDKLGDTVGTSYQQEPLAAPSFDLSFPKFEAPTFNFDFKSSFAAEPTSALFTTEKNESKSNTPAETCQRCGSAKQSDFSFCLSCGISF